MPTSSTDSSSCRLEWRPSRWGIVAAAVLPLSCAGALADSGLPDALPRGIAPAVVPAVLLAFGAAAGASWSVRAARRPPVVLRLCPGRRLAVGEEVAGSATLTERWPLVVLRRDDGSGAWVFWPDTLSPESRRRCRLWADAAPASVVPHHWMG